LSRARTLFGPKTPKKKAEFVGSGKAHWVKKMKLTIKKMGLDPRGLQKHYKRTMAKRLQQDGNRGDRGKRRFSPDEEPRGS